MAQVLIVAPDTPLRVELRASFEANGFEVAELGAEGLDAHAIESIDFSIYQCVIGAADPLSTVTGELLKHCHAVPVILISHRNDVREAVTAMKLGASDFLVVPFEPDELVAAVERSVTERHRDRGGAAAGDGLSMLGRSPPMQSLFAHIAKIGPTDSTVLIRGESGTGKALVARALHRASRRNHAPLIALNCAAIPPQLLETELFGYSPSSAQDERHRTGLLETANGGTLFLDEIGELGLEAQARLLRVLEDGELRRFGSTAILPVNVRLLAATHHDLARLTRTGRFRDDLYYRLNVVTLDIPPLRDRGDDAGYLAEEILARTCRKLAKPALQLTGDALQALREYHWPGNVRELENALERAVILCERESIGAELLALDNAPSTVVDAVPAHADQTSLEDYFVSFVLSHQEQLTETELAEKLGISRKSLWERRQRLNIPRKKTRTRGPRRENG